MHAKDHQHAISHLTIGINQTGPFAPMSYELDSTPKILLDERNSHFFIWQAIIYGYSIDQQLLTDS